MLFAMMIELACPRCKRSLSLPDELTGQYAFCKHCEGQVWVPADVSTAASKKIKETLTPPSAETVTSPQGQTPRTNNNLVSSNNPKTPPIPESNQRPLLPADTLNHPATKPAEYRPTDKTSPPPHPIPAPQSTKEQVPQHSSRHYAELITEEPAQSRLEPESDGQLPELTLETQNGDKSGEKPTFESNRLITFGVICASLLASSMLLLIKTTPSTSSQTNTTEQIIARIQEKYFGPENGPWPRYQRYLRDAALARSQGDDQEAERYYQKSFTLT